MPGRIFVTGDCHHDFRKFNMDCFPQQKELTKEDFVIITGDFGGIWAVGWESKEEKYWLDWLESRSFTTVFCCGNHENFDRLYGYPVKKWHGGMVHEIRPSVLHLMRGQVFDLAGHSFFVLGGAKSHDISDGILDTEEPDFKTKKKMLDSIQAVYRIRHLSWWEQELPSLEELEAASANLEACNYRVDYIITHCIYDSLQEKLGEDFAPDMLTNFLQTIKNHTVYQQWFFGHYHGDVSFHDGRDILLYDTIYEIGIGSVYGILDEDIQ